MPSYRAFVRQLRVSYVLGFAALFLVPIAILAIAVTHASSKTQQISPVPSPQQTQPQPAPPLLSNYDKSIFSKPIPKDELAFLAQFSGAPANDLYLDKEFHKLMKSFVPDSMFHYGRDMPLSDALDLVFKNSRLPVLVRDGRYVVLASDSGPYLSGRAVLWLDMQQGIALGGFFFHPINGEPTPSIVIFSRQVKQQFLGMSQLPPAFADDLVHWSQESNIPSLTTSYFITGSNQRILLEHDEDYCAPVDGAIVPPNSNCLQMTADAADIDMTAASYLDRTNHTTNATAWLPEPDQAAWLQARNNTCGAGPNTLDCDIRLTHERTHMLIRRPPSSHPPTSRPTHS
jgi:hypothetical protein